MEPYAVNIDNQAQVWKNLYNDITEPNVRQSSFKLNDSVRISKWKDRFEKGYKNNWSREIFTIHQILPRQPIVYKLKDLKGEIIKGAFYEKEIQKVTDSGFVTQLPSPITLDGKWEVGLAEIIYPHTLYNVNETNNMFGFDLGDGKLNTRKLSPGSYETIPDILKAMSLTSHEVILEKGLCSMLGFQPQVIENITESSFTADPHTEFPIFYVYSDIVQPVVVGHVEAPLLRVVRISGKDGDVINVLYDRPHYVNVIRQSFQTTEIEIRLN
ncbi:uncharacterized transposon-derived protein F54H12.3 [Caerostris darwini]|uniref:Uncharacterized transposon-derived protein F54H12.3 n=1 Tax=Caerostris darwini TaxID=1538125 RepID=A0AAV4RTK8_9ARAC|nr:uncharacterized transposon-derived protein F54H12.3 [Caerostris darwini]